MKKTLLLFLFALCVSINVQAQFYDSDIHYYIKSGEVLSNSSDVWMFSFNGRSAKCTKAKKSEVANKLKQSSTYWKNNLSNNLNYDSEFSTSVRTTYAGKRYGDQKYVQTGPFTWEWIQPVIGKWYAAFSADKSEFIYFYVQNNSENVNGKTYWQEVSVSDLMPKGVNKDFLY